MKVLLDTSAYIRLLKGSPDLVDSIMGAETVLMSPIVLGELMFGFRKGTRVQVNMKDLEEFLTQDTVHRITLGETTADRYSRISVQLKRQGTPIPTNDIWIAAQAMEHGADLLTFDRHFEMIHGLVCTVY
jgi:tRNA(fMet)-specific endonuclease VapC